MVYKEIFNPTKTDKIIADNKFLDMFMFFFNNGITEIKINPKKIRVIPNIANDEIDSLKNITPQIGIKNTADPLANGYTIDISANLYALPSKL